jgi:hypothetical protein
MGHLEAELREAVLQEANNLRLYLRLDEAQVYQLAGQKEQFYAQALISSCFDLSKYCVPLRHEWMLFCTVAP